MDVGIPGCVLLLLLQYHCWPSQLLPPVGQPFCFSPSLPEHTKHLAQVVQYQHQSQDRQKGSTPPWGPHQRGCEGVPQGWFRNALCMVKLRRVSLCPVFSWQMQAGSGLCMTCQQPHKQCHCCSQICLSALAFAMDAQAPVELCSKVMALGLKSLWSQKTWEQHSSEQRETQAVQPQSRCMPCTDGQMHTC